MVSDRASTRFVLAGVARALCGDRRRRAFIVADGGQLFHRDVATSDGPLFVLPEHEGETDGPVALTGRMPTDPAPPATHPAEAIEAQSFRAMQKLTHP